MKQKVKVNNRGIDSAGITKDHKEAIAELIWNSFDAKATNIKLIFASNEIDSITSLSVVDNGEGINIDDLSDTFGSFLDSKKKKTHQRSSYVKGKKGKGRFSFSAFANEAIWKTVYNSSDDLLEYEIVVNKQSKESYETRNKRIVKNKPTGTTVVLSDLFGVTAFSFSNNEFREFLAQQFGWFLLLNRDRQFSITLNSEELEYDYLIGDSENKIFEIKSEDGKKFQFQMTYIRWTEKMGDKYYFYLLGSDDFEKAKFLTSYNNNAIEFHHSVFVKSDFFDDFSAGNNDSLEPIFGSNPSSPVYKALKKRLNEYLDGKQKEFIREKAANKLISIYEKKGVMPTFSENKLGQAQRKELITVVKEIYSAQPNIFKNLKTEQAKTVVGFLSLLLNSEERDHILNIIESVTNLSSEERLALSKVIGKSKLTNIIKTLRMLESRFQVVELLKLLVFDNSKFTTEREHVQKAIEQNYWLFGEQFNLVSADETFETSLKEYIYILDGEKTLEQIKMDSSQKKRRMDVFICKKRAIPDLTNHEYTIDENIIVELKRPSVNIGIDQYRQVEDYLEVIIKEHRFNSQRRNWKFFLIGKQIDEVITRKYETMKDRNKRYLVNAVGNYEIYAMTWDDLFHSFDIKHRFLFDKLDFDKKVLAEELKIMGFEFSKIGSDKITKEIIQLSTTTN